MHMMKYGKEEKKSRPGMVAHAYNHSYLGGNGHSPGKKPGRPHLNQSPIIPLCSEAQMEGLQCRPAQHKARSYLKTNQYTHPEGLAEWLMQYSTCLLSTTP
jgi:hypothetical protein